MTSPLNLEKMAKMFAEDLKCLKGDPTELALLYLSQAYCIGTEETEHWWKDLDEDEEYIEASFTGWEDDDGQSTKQ